MKKRIYITEDVAKELTEIMKPLSDLPQDIKNVLKNFKGILTGESAGSMNMANIVYEPMKLIIQVIKQD